MSCAPRLRLGRAAMSPAPGVSCDVACKSLLSVRQLRIGCGLVNFTNFHSPASCKFRSQKFKNLFTIQNLKIYQIYDIILLEKKKKENSKITKKMKDER